MTARIDTMVSPFAPWSLRLALFALQVAIVGFVLHRFASLSTPVAVNVLFAAVAVALIGAGFAILSLKRIWHRGEAGAGRSTAALLIGVALAAIPLSALPSIISKPGINDITTDANVPPAIIAAASDRGFGANSVDYPGDQYSLAQGASYPEILPILTNRSLAEVFDLAHDVVEKRGWTILAERPPAGRGSIGTIEAVVHSFVFGFPDDVVLRISGNAEQARVDIRSTSRYGLHDLGRNAERVKDLIKELQARIEASVRLGDLQSEAAEAEKQAAEAASASVKKKNELVTRVNRRKKRDRARPNARGARAQKAKRQQKPGSFQFDIAPQR